ncbi:pyrroline-5-carboxylate reductase family protein [Fructobacillus fructosus]|uniref:pyrroline-5-carboxylate reductase family protein n=1 Tax=Fructobacillus fructosus TaxID=1631 RepID=UPI00200B4728|nr:pyrroline-5-carboxylate reductase dimerization domain-containing protein [Fructobacillus fructosus]MCK8638026.1 NAD(P)-binding domain-containing protein [Fructobacillus fructosus]
MKIGIVGLGHMGTAIAKGLVRQESLPNLTVCALSSNLKKAEELSITGFEEPRDFLADNLDLLILTVPAKVTVAVLEQLKAAGLRHDTIILSAAAGVSHADLAAVMNKSAIFPFIPNIPVAVNAGTIALSVADDVLEGQLATVSMVLESLGDVLRVREDQLGIAGVVGGCAPAFIDVMMDAMEDAAVGKGLDRKTAAEVIASVVRGTASLAQQSPLSAADLKGQITSPGGTTIQGVLALDEHGFRHAVQAAILAADR